MNTDIAGMIACAFNNFSRKPPDVVAQPQAVLKKYADVYAGYESRWGKRVIAVENIAGETLIAAMDEFAAGTDWSGWKRRDWVAAYATLRS